MKCVTKVSKAGSAAFFLGVVLIGYGGSSNTAKAGTDLHSDRTGTHSLIDGTGTGVSVNELAVPEKEKSAVLSWNAPESRVNGDGIKMAELDKYIIRYGQDADNLDREVVIADAQVDAHMTYKVSGLDAGIWYFTILVQDNKGLLSAPSAVVDKEIKS